LESSDGKFSTARCGIEMTCFADKRGFDVVLVGNVGYSGFQRGLTGVTISSWEPS